MAKDNRRLPLCLACVLLAIVSLPLLGAKSDPVEYTKTLKTQDAKCHQDRPDNHVDLPSVQTFAFPQEGKPCIMAMMGLQAKVDYMDKNDEDMTTFINIPANAVVTGSCKSPQWMALTWKGLYGSSRSLTIKANPNISSFQEDDTQEYSVEQVLLRMEIDEKTFPGVEHAGQTVTASLDNQQLFEAPIDTSFKCKEILLNLPTNDPIGSIAITFKDMQFQAYADKSTFSKGVSCKSSESTDYVAIGIGCFLAATIISALGSYVFCRWWRKKDRGS